MIMIKLNLLPPAYKKNLELTGLRRIFLSLIARIFAVLFIFLIILSSMFLYLSILVRYQEQLIKNEEQDARMKELLTMEETIAVANEKINRVFGNCNERVYWTGLMEKFVGLVPVNIYLTEFHYGAENNELRLSGWASNRNAFLSFQKALESSSLFGEINIPLANLLKQENVNFNFTLKPIKASFNELTQHAY